MTTPIEVPKGRLIARIPQITIRMPQTMDHPLVFLTTPTVVSAFIEPFFRYFFFRAGLPKQINLRQFDNFVATAARNRFEHEQAKPVACFNVIVGGIESSWR
jgi:hypothetical protein